jgi:hypothetical protein
LLLVEVIFLKPLNLLSFSILGIENVIFKKPIFQILLSVGCFKGHHEVFGVVKHKPALEYGVCLHLVLMHLHLVSH